MPEVILDCESGEFSLDAASGGVAALIDVAWQLYVKSLVNSDFVAVIDEPENHLHPEMQLAIMPGLIEAFPQVQFIVATHNPFIVTSVEDSKVFILNYENNRVISNRIDEVDRSASANQVLMDVLGLPAPIPLWVQKRINELVSQFSGRELTSQTLAELRAQMNQIGLGGMFPELIDRLIGPAT
jgi:predicted ATP-binding protein involved in virulence